MQSSESISTSETIVPTLLPTPLPAWLCLTQNLLLAWKTHFPGHVFRTARSFSWRLLQSGSNLLKEERETELNSTEAAAGGFLNPGVSSWKSSGGCWPGWWGGRGGGYSCRHLLKLDSCPPLETGTQGTSFLMTAFQRDGFQVLKKDIPGQQHIVPQKATKTKFTVVSFL